MNDPAAHTCEHKGRIARPEQIAEDTRRVLDKLDSRCPCRLGVTLAGFGGLLGAIARGFHRI